MDIFQTLPMHFISRSSGSWDDAFIAEDAKKRSRRLQQGAGY